MVCGVGLDGHPRYRGPHNNGRHAFIAPCPGCGKPIKRKPADWIRGRRYCSLRCYWRFNKGKTLKPKIAVRCPICGKIRLRWPSRAERLTCSRKCTGELLSLSQRGTNHWAWKGGTITTQQYGPDWSRIRTAYRQAHIHCERCHKALSRVVHHIIPVRTLADYTDAHQEQNLMALCRRCHNFEHRVGSQIRLAV